MAEYVIDVEDITNHQHVTQDRTNVENAIRKVMDEWGVLGEFKLGNSDEMIHGVADAVFDALLTPTDAAIHIADGMTDFVLPEPFENTTANRHTEMKNAIGHMIKYIKTGI